jgi:hypothetical protein
VKFSYKDRCHEQTFVHLASSRGYRIGRCARTNIRNSWFDEAMQRYHAAGFRPFNTVSSILRWLDRE